MSAKTIEAGRIAGAQMCFTALRKLEQAAEDGAFIDTAAMLSEVRTFVAALGSMTSEQEGAIAVLVEYIASELDGSTPTLSPGCWRPLSAMTDTERQAMVEQWDAEHAADDLAIEAARKVVSIDSRRVAQ